MTRSTLPGALALLFCLGSVLPSAHAQQAQNANDTARSLVREGDVLRAQGDVEHALERYSAAYRLVHVPTLGLEVAKTQVLRGSLLDAKAAADEVARQTPIPGEPASFGAARSGAAELSASLLGRIPSLLIDLSPKALQWTLAIDGVVVPAGREVLPVRLNPGSRRVQIRAPGFVPADQTVQLAEGEHRQLAVVLARELPPAQAFAPAASPVVVQSNVAATGSAASEFPPSAVLDAWPPVVIPPSPRPASTASAPPPAAVAAAVASSSAPLPVAPIPRSSVEPAPAALRADPDTAAGARTHLYVGLGIGAAGFLVGSTTGILAMTSKPDCPGGICSPSDRSDIAHSRSYGRIANVSFGVAGVGLLYGLAWWAFGMPDAEAINPLVALQVAPAADGAMLKLSAGF